MADLTRRGRPADPLALDARTRRVGHFEGGPPARTPNLPPAGHRPRGRPLEESERYLPEPSRLDLVDLSELARACVDELPIGSRGPHVVVDLDLATDLPFVLADPCMLQELVARLVRRASEVIGEDWGVVTVGTGVLGLGRTPLARAGSVEAGLHLHHVYLEVHGTGPAVGLLSSGHAEHPFAARGCGPLERDKAAALLDTVDGTLVVDPIATAGVSVLLLLPYAAADLPV